MKLLEAAAEHMDVIEPERLQIARLEKYLGSLNIRAGMISDKPLPWFGWMVEPEDQSLVMVFNNFNWDPDVGPQRSLGAVLKALMANLDTCDGIAVGKPGRHEQVGRPEQITLVPSRLTLERQLEAVSADLELIGRAFMEGQPAGSCFTPAEIAEWVSVHRRREIAVINAPKHDATSNPMKCCLNDNAGAREPHLFQDPPAAPYCQLCGAGRLHAIHSIDARRAR